MFKVGHHSECILFCLENKYHLTITALSKSPILNNKDCKRDQLSTADNLSLRPLFFSLKREKGESKNKIIIKNTIERESTDLRCHTMTEIHDGNVVCFRSLVQTQVVS